MGIHLGEVILNENPPADVARGAKPLEVEGLAKPIAARLMSLAEGRQTLITRGIYDMARRSVVGADPESSPGSKRGISAARRLRWLAHGSYVFKGIQEPVEVFEVGLDGLAPLARPRDFDKAQRVVPGVPAIYRRSRVLAVLVLLLLLGFLGAHWLRQGDAGPLYVAVLRPQLSSTTETQDLVGRAVHGWLLCGQLQHGRHPLPERDPTRLGIPDRERHRIRWHPADRARHARRIRGTSVPDAEPFPAIRGP